MGIKAAARLRVTGRRVTVEELKFARKPTRIERRAVEDIVHECVEAARRCKFPDDHDDWITLDIGPLNIETVIVWDDADIVH